MVLILRKITNIISEYFSLNQTILLQGERMGKNKSTRTDGVDDTDNQTKGLADTKKIPKGYYKKAPQSPK